MYAIINTTAGPLNLRSGPGSNYSVVTAIPKGEIVLVTEYGAEWCAVSWGEWSGYAATRYLNFNVNITPEPSESPTPTPTPTPTPKPTPTPTPSPTPTRTPDDGVAGSIAFTITQTGLYDEAYNTSSLILVLPEGEMVTVQTYGPDWCYVTYYTMSGWIRTAHLHIISSATPTPTPTPSPSAEPSPDAGLPGEQITHAPSGREEWRLAWVSAAVTAVKLRETAAEDARVLAELPAGTQLKVLESRDTWSHVLWQDKEGYVFTRHLAWVSPEESMGVLYINTARDGLALRSKPSTDSTVLTRIDRGEQVLLLADLGDWCQVQYGSLSGYCASAYLSKTRPEASISDDTMLLDPTLTDVIGWYALISTHRESSIYLRAWCSTHAPDVTEVQHGAQVILLQKGDIWCKISCKGVTGYCLTSELTLIPPQT
jgi:uncharacterized protein YraI